MSEIIAAIYEKGVFKPLQALEIPEGQHVRLVVDMDKTTTSEGMLVLAAQVYEGLSPQDVDTIEEIACNRRNFFRDTDR
ncbi:MAG: hypothetical protein ETSY2_34470 [Candidatus Entotheonella gemina]|uniref:Antitoxin n=1 Tax=Candidatus Entotheonella gemina TaxID=1429439 RepID=W4LYX6_9BACT|nr:MAG: hypothetical protein ETSY2_34470 [Candidatus Entotheonella gemina]